jgi:hypothetical protein
MYKFATSIDLLLEYNHKSNFDGKIKCSSLANLILDRLVIGIVINLILMVELDPRQTFYWNSHKSNFDGRIRSKIDLLLEYNHQSNFDGRIKCSSLVKLDPRQICY